jgi:hypothetical protein
LRTVPYAVPSVAPRKSAGENIPPDAPDPKVRDVAMSFKANRSKEVQRKLASRKNILNGRVADAFNIVMAKQRQHGVHHRADCQHPEWMLDVIPSFDSRLEELFKAVKRNDEER